MVRLREILDPDLREKVRAKLAEWRGLAVGAVPDWYELDDLDMVDLLQEIRQDESGEDPNGDDYRD